MNITLPGLKGFGLGLAILPSADVTPGAGAPTARRRARALIGRSRVGAAAGGLARRADLRGGRTCAAGGLAS
ncbi:MAG: hypothetical protein IOC54_10310 [Methylobacterium sp.]|nr:hypothetical protein [Methylobacterium sp.]